MISAVSQVARTRKKRNDYPQFGETPTCSKYLGTREVDLGEGDCKKYQKV